MKQKLATLLIHASAVIGVFAVAVIVFGPVIRLEFPRVSLWALIYAIMALWAYSPEVRPLRELWGFGICRIIISVRELVETWFFTEAVHPATHVGLVLLLAGTVLYVVGLALWGKRREGDNEAQTE